MLKRILISVIVVVALLPTAAVAEGPKAIQEDCWEFMVNNAFRTADEYAMYRFPQATFITAESKLVKQVAGDYKGNYLLYLTSKVNGDISFAGLLPTFDLNKSCKDIDDENPILWKVIIAKYNGRPF